MKRVKFLVVIFLITMAPLCAAEGEPSSTVPVRFSFGTETTTHIEFGFTRNAVSDMGIAITEVNSIELVATSKDSLKYTFPYEIFAYWRLLAPTSYTLSLRHTGYLENPDSSNIADRLYFTLVCGSETIPSNSDHVIFTHNASITPTIQTKPITLTTTGNNAKAVNYITTLTLTLTAIE